MKTLQREFPRALALTTAIFLLIQILNVILGSELKINSHLFISFCFTAGYTMSLYLLKNAFVIRFAAATSMPSLDAARAGPIPYIVPTIFKRREFEKSMW